MNKYYFDVYYGNNFLDTITVLAENKEDAYASARTQANTNLAVEFLKEEIDDKEEYLADMEMEREREDADR